LPHVSNLALQQLFLFLFALTHASLGRAPCEELKNQESKIRSEISGEAVIILVHFPSLISVPFSVGLGARAGLWLVKSWKAKAHGTRMPRLETRKTERVASSTKSFWIPPLSTTRYVVAGLLFELVAGAPSLKRYKFTRTG